MGASVSEPFNERRQPRPMRILYMPMRSFLQRFILRGQFPSLVPRSEAGLALPPAAGLAPPPVQARERATWKCGVTQLDAQNEALLRAIRQFLGALKQAVGPEAMEEALTALELHLEGHLPMEEAYLEQVQFPDQVGHRAQPRLSSTWFRPFTAG